MEQLFVGLAGRDTEMLKTLLAVADGQAAWLTLCIARDPDSVRTLRLEEGVAAAQSKAAVIREELASRAGCCPLLRALFTHRP